VSVAYCVLYHGGTGITTKKYLFAEIREMQVKLKYLSPHNYYLSLLSILSSPRKMGFFPELMITVTKPCVSYHVHLLPGPLGLSIPCMTKENKLRKKFFTLFNQLLKDFGQQGDTV
jgi:hypothetical protein